MGRVLEWAAGKRDEEKFVYEFAPRKSINQVNSAKYIFKKSFITSDQNETRWRMMVKKSLVNWFIIEGKESEKNNVLKRLQLTTTKTYFFQLAPKLAAEKFYFLLNWRGRFHRVMSNHKE